MGDPAELVGSSEKAENPRLGAEMPDIDTIVTGPLGEWLLENGAIPCEDSGKKTRRFRIKLEDIINFLVQHIQ